MPDPNKFDNKADFMDACMHQCRKVENKEQNESVAQCINMWEGKMKKKARRVLFSYLKAVDKESGIVTDLRKIPRWKEIIKPRQETVTHKPAEKDYPFAEKGEPVTVIDAISGKETIKPYDPVIMKEKKFEPVKQCIK